MLTLQPVTVIDSGIPTVAAGPRLDVHNVDAFSDNVDALVGSTGAVHIDARTTKHLDKAGLGALTRIIERGGDAVTITIDAGPAVQVAALLGRHEALAAAVLPLAKAVAA